MSCSAVAALVSIVALVVMEILTRMQRNLHAAYLSCYAERWLEGEAKAHVLHLSEIVLENRTWVKDMQAMAGQLKPHPTKPDYGILDAAPGASFLARREGA